MTNSSEYNTAGMDNSLHEKGEFSGIITIHDAQIVFANISCI